jgi:hypothetical protein
METERYSETLVTICQVEQRYVREDINLPFIPPQTPTENLSNIFYFFFRTSGQFSHDVLPHM